MMHSSSAAKSASHSRTNSEQASGSTQTAVRQISDAARRVHTRSQSINSTPRENRTSLIAYFRGRNVKVNVRVGSALMTEATSSAPRPYPAYHDWSANASPLTLDAKKNPGGITDNFPVKLRRIIEDPSDDSARWNDHGRSFRVYDKKAISEKYSVKETSFSRQMNLWNFHRMSRVDDTGRGYDEYYNELFLQNRDDLQVNMIRTRVKGVGTRVSCDSSTFPDFNKMPPVTLLEGSRLPAEVSTSNVKPASLKTPPVEKSTVITRSKSKQSNRKSDNSQKAASRKRSLKQSQAAQQAARVQSHRRKDPPPGSASSPAAAFSAPAQSNPVSFAPMQAQPMIGQQSYPQQINVRHDHYFHLPPFVAGSPVIGNQHQAALPNNQSNTTPDRYAFVDPFSDDQVDFDPVAEDRQLLSFSEFDVPAQAAPLAPRSEAVHSGVSQQATSASGTEPSQQEIDALDEIDLDHFDPSLLENS